MSRTEKCCQNCHFLDTWARPRGKENPLEVSRKQRDRLMGGEDMRSVVGAASLACYKDVWDSAKFREGSCRNIPAIMTGDRGESCFFYPHTPGVDLGAAAELERRAADRREAERDRALTRRALSMAFWVLVVSVLTLAVNLFWNVWKYHNPSP